MIPQNIQRIDVLRAIQDIEYSGIPETRHSTKWSLVYERKKYPPKYLISLANRYANGQELTPDRFSGGDESNTYLENLGYGDMRDEPTDHVLNFTVL